MKKSMMKQFLSALILIAMILTLSACGGKKEEPAKSADLPAVLTAFNLSEDMMLLDLDDLGALYYVNSADVEQCAAAIHMSGINADEIILLEAVDADAAARLKKILDDRYQAKLNEMRDYIPEEYAIIESCSVTQNGNYVAMIVAPNAAELVDIYNKSFK